jgi:DEAD/DEAH box helicase domain-containing protein
LGIDIGGVDAVLMTGYPGSVSGLRQQAGRAGRKMADSVAVLVASGSPIDQYLMNHPEYLTDRSPESALIDPDHPVILLGHLECAAFELPFKENESFGTVNTELLQEYLQFMAQSGKVNLASGRYFWTDSAYPASSLSLRSSDSRSIALITNVNGNNQTIGEVDYLSSLWMVHPNAIYFMKEFYFVQSLDLEKSEAILRAVDEDYYTEPVKKVTLVKINEQEAEYYPGSKTTFGEIQVTTEIVVIKKFYGIHERSSQLNLWRFHQVPFVLRPTGFH